MAQKQRGIHHSTGVSSASFNTGLGAPTSPPLHAGGGPCQAARGPGISLSRAMADSSFENA